MIKTSTLSLSFIVLFSIFANLTGKAQSWLDVNSTEISTGRGTNLSFALTKTGTPFVAYSESALAGRAVVKKFDGTRWVQVGTGGISVDYAGELALALDKNNVPYLAFTDMASNGQLSVKKFNGTNWVNVGTGSVSAGYPQSIQLVISTTGVPYLSYTDNGRGWIKQLNGTNWQTIGANGFALNPTEKIALTLNAQNVPYVAFADPAQGGQVTVQRWNGSAWASVGANGVGTGTACDLSIVLAGNGTPYVAYREFRGNALDKLGKMKMKQFNGTTWEEVGTTTFSDSWVYFAAIGVDKNNVPYVAYRESSTGIGNPGLTKVKRLNGREWEEIGTSNLTSGSLTDVSLAIADSGLLYVAFADGVRARPATVLKLDVPKLVLTTKAPTELAILPNSDNGISSTDGITNVSMPTITGMANPTSLVTIYVDGKNVGTCQADSTGRWTFTFTEALDAGHRLITATASDALGNTSAPSVSLSLNLDFTAPVFSGVTEGVAYRTDKSITYSGGTATLNNLPYVSNTAISAEGNYTLLVTDVAGNSISVSFFIDKTIPVASVLINNNAGLTNINNATINIVAPDAAEMRFYDDNDNSIWSNWEPVNAIKAWALSNGSGSKWVKLQVRDAAGNMSATVSDNITLDQTAPTAVLAATVTSTTSLATIPVKITFSENVTGFTANSITVTNGLKGTFSGSGKAYTLNVVAPVLLPSMSATISVNMAAGLVTDAAGNKNAAATTLTVNYVSPITAPIVATNAIALLNANTMNVGGNVTKSGGSPVLARGIVYSTTSTAPTINSAKLLLGLGEGVFSSTLKLKAGLTYYVRAYATNLIGTSYGTVQKITIPAATAAVTQSVNASAPKVQLSNYPNPFQNQTTITFTSGVATDYQLQVYDVNGTLMNSLKAGKAKAGEKVLVDWMATNNMKAGIYIVRLITNAGVQNLKVIYNN
ncbi:Ig-like domain-containing protein [Adhaeribacter radiodurans]|uniref:T9SS type A sorting domain-containing protein n=1 Tax=Adhaeribacter radiodurans TaxID=2745197 RepID=A0A7L7L9H3_9BACT|nr:Ig-like domain-containing protein [Adhaeribacter radiodurans]QMU29496.1 T9SS type A sorting domain-containing protein [Adhaeribacter radiodurans]